jgi:hypothetical protein
MIPRYFYDPFVRQALQGIYVGITGSDHNTRLLSVVEQILNADGLTFQGNELSRRGFHSGVRWIKSIYPFMRSDVDGSSHILMPFKLCSQYLTNIRTLHERTSTLKGLVYAVSRPFYSNFFKQKVVNLSLVMPDLGICMAYRCPESAIQGDCLYKEAEIPNAQPIPFLNRIHPTKIPDKLKTVNLGRVGLDKYHFLSVALRDLQTLTKSFALENFCETYSTVYGRRMLGAACIVSGRVKDISDGGTIIISDISNAELCYKLKLSHTPVGYIDRITKDSYVRIFCVTWYRFRVGMLKDPEVLHVEICDDKLETEKNDLEGYVRVRGCVRVDDVVRTYSKQAVELLSRNIEFDGSWLVWEDGLLEKEEDLFSIFRHTVNMIRRVRLERGDPLIPLPRLLNRDAVRAEHYAAVVQRMKMLNFLFKLISMEEKKECLAGSPRELVEIVKVFARDYYQREIEDALYYLRGLGIIRRTGKHCVGLTPLAHRVAYSAVKTDIQQFLRKFYDRQGWITIFELAENQEYPLSVLLWGVNDLVAMRYLVPVKCSGFEGPIAWKKASELLDESHIIENLLPHIRRTETAVLGILSKLSYPLSTVKLMEELENKERVRLYRHILIKILEALKKQGRLEQDAEGMWFYPWDIRLADFLRDNPDRLFTEDEIVEAIQLPRLKYSPKQFLDRLMKNGTVARVDGFFSWKHGSVLSEKQCINLIKRKIEADLPSMLGDQSSIDVFSFKARLRIRITVIKHSHGFMDTCSHLKTDAETLANLIFDDLVSRGMVRVVKGLVVLNRSGR